jgi:hypothetical protein
VVELEEGKLACHIRGRRRQQAYAQYRQQLALRIVKQIRGWGTGAKHQPRRGPRETARFHGEPSVRRSECHPRRRQGQFKSHGLHEPRGTAVDRDRHPIMG